MKFYYTTIIILLFFLFKNNGILLLLNFNLYFILLLLFILIIYSILLSNLINLKLFYFYKNIKDLNISLQKSLENELPEVKINIEKFIRKTKFNNSIFTNKNPFNKNLAKNFSTSTKKSKEYLGLNEYIENSETLKFLPADNFIDIEFEKAKELKNFHTNYNKGFYGYNLFYHLGTYIEIDFLSSYLIPHPNYKKKMIEFLDSIPENTIFTILPIIRYESTEGDYASITLTKALKITRDTPPEVLGWKLKQLIKTKTIFYNINVHNADIFIMGRPWLTDKDFSIPLKEINKILSKNLDIDVNNIYENPKEFEIVIKNKMDNIQEFEYKNILFGEYGNPVLGDKNKENLINLNDQEYAIVETTLNDSNFIINKVIIWDKHEKLYTKETSLKCFQDTKTENGFIREFNSVKYFYDLDNKIYNVEKEFICQPFPIYGKAENYDFKIGSIDFETFGSNQGLGSHQVYAGGWSIKNKTEMYYIEKGEPSENLVNRLFLDILNDKSLNNYTFYVHNLGRFDSIFILKALIKNKDFKIIPVWKDIGILSVSIEYNENKIKLLDSLQLIKGNLEGILNSFNCTIKKGYFPYNFVNEKNLEYIGEKPALSY